MILSSSPARSTAPPTSVPARNARHGVLFVRSGTGGTGVLKIRNARYREDPLPIDPECGCVACANGPYQTSRAFLHHLARAGELTAAENGRIVVRDSELAGVSQGDDFYPVRVTATGNGVVELVNTPAGSAILKEEGNGRIIQR